MRVILAHEVRQPASVESVAFAGGAAIRPMRADDVAAVERVTGEAYHQLDVRTRPRDWPAPSPRTDVEVVRRRNQLVRTLERDPGGCWVAEDASGAVGAVVSTRRELMWLLADLAVAPAAQAGGLGARLLDAALSYGAGCLRGMVWCSNDPRAVRRGRLAGFTLHPTMLARGPLDRSLLPVVDQVRDGSLADRDLADSVDRLTRGAAHGPDHDALAAAYPMVVVDRPNGQGYAYVGPQGPTLLAASNARTAQRLLWESLARSEPGRPVEVGHLTTAQEWAIDVAIAARLQVHQRHYLGLRHLKPPAPYLPSATYL